ncbi:hypothetical protein NAP1_14528 [Erythrobacter sp. NAP1]|uniref:hypothetical protein n=1 Tax=Erythrobacter sp. NAP1 TaxID=237727 RepID=UPI00006879BC|nr:hypothetical protein [Erythrobacter sp. NAP1]EAQ28823.1 hypothetical protein NAP1_14528 [Erythrobacter sp. NAP1]
MSTVTACDVPEGSLLAQFGGPEDYRDCFWRDVAGEVTLAQFIERFYSSTAFLPERLILKALRTPASSADIRALAKGETDRFGAWRLVERREARSSSGAVGRENAQVLLESKDTNTASWFCVEPREGGTRLYFGSWVGGIDQSGWRAMLAAHVWYSRVLLGGV